MSAPSRQRLVHGLAGIVPAGRDKVRAVCFCSWPTTPRTTEARALAALEEHGFSDPVCDVCGRNREHDGRTDYERCGGYGCCMSGPFRDRYTRVRVVRDDLGTIFVCADDERACLDAAARRQVELDRAALGEAVPAPRLRLIAGGAQ